MNEPLKLIFVVNEGSGAHQVDYASEIKEYLSGYPQVTYRMFTLAPGCQVEKFQKMCHEFHPDTVVAVGGDGTVKFVAEELIDTPISLGIIPAGSANGLARDLEIPEDLSLAMQKILENQARRIHLIRINGELCIHLSDVGFNAHTVKRFKDLDRRGMRGYMQAGWKALWAFRRMRAHLLIDGKPEHLSAVMVVFANASRYGTGVVINPQGDLQDTVFEVIVVRRMSLWEILKMTFTNRDPDPRKTVVFSAREAELHTRSKHHFQIDGEYIGKRRHVQARLIPDCLRVIY